MDVLKCVNDRRPVGMNSAGNGGMALQYGTVSQPLVWPLNFSPFFFFFGDLNASVSSQRDS